MQKKIKTGFTIIELLIIITLVGLLAGIVIVSIRGVREKGPIANTVQYAATLYRSLSDSCLGKWDFDEGTGFDAKDSSGNKQDALLGWGPWNCPNPPDNTGWCPSWKDDTPYKEVGGGAGKKSLYFDGVDDFIIVTSGIVNNFSQVTVSAWIKCTMPSGAGQGIIFRRGNLSVAGDFQLIKPANLNIARLIFPAMVAPNYVDTTKAINDGKWHFLVASYNGSVLRIYIDGQLDGAPVNTTGGFSAGSSNAYRMGDTYMGYMDEVRLYTSALTQAQIEKLYAEGLEKIQLAEK